MDRSGIGNRHRRTPSNSHRLRLTEQHHHVGPLDSFSNASFMEVSHTEFYVVAVLKMWMILSIFLWE